MKYLIETGPTNARANEMDAKGGPGALLGYLAERFHPEAFYISLTARRAYIVVDTEPAGLHELIQIIGRELGQDPTITPVIAGSEAGAMIATASENAKKAPRL